METLFLLGPFPSRVQLDYLAVRCASKGRPVVYEGPSFAAVVGQARAEAPGGLALDPANASLAAQHGLPVRAASPDELLVVARMLATFLGAPAHDEAKDTTALDGFLRAVRLFSEARAWEKWPTERALAVRLDDEEAPSAELLAFREPTGAKGLFLLPADGSAAHLAAMSDRREFSASARAFSGLGLRLELEPAWAVEILARAGLAGIPQPFAFDHGEPHPFREGELERLSAAIEAAAELSRTRRTARRTIAGSGGRTLVLESPSKPALVARVVAEPSRRRQLEEPKLLLLWRDALDGGREGVLAVPSACENPACACDDVTLELHRIDDRLGAVALLADGSIELESRGEPQPEQVAEARLELGSNLVQPERSEAEELPLSVLREQLDAELHTTLRAYVRQVKGGPAPGERSPALEGWIPGEPLAYGDAFARDPTAGFVVNKRKWAAYDHYCVDLGCECGVVDVAFFDDREAFVGDLNLGLSSSQFEVTPERAQDRALLWELAARWLATVSREELRLRYRRMRSFAQTLPQPPPIDAPAPAGGPPPPPRALPAAAEPSRNAPCPCGSGKKYKKCCLDKAAQRP